MSEDSPFRIRDIDEDWIEIEFHHKVNVRKYNPMHGFQQHLQRMGVECQKCLDHHIHQQVILPTTLIKP